MIRPIFRRGRRALAFIFVIFTSVIGLSIGIHILYVLLFPLFVISFSFFFCFGFGFVSVEFRLRPRVFVKIQTVAKCRSVGSVPVILFPGI